MSAAAGPTRRGLLAAGAALTALSSAPVLAYATARQPVVFIHQDRPMLDPSGLAMAYRPPAAYPAALPQSLFDRQPYL